MMKVVKRTSRLALLIATLMTSIGILGVGPARGEGRATGHELPAFAGSTTILRLNLGPDDPIIDPRDVLLGENPGGFVVNQLFLGLTKFNDELLTIEPQLATSWTQNTAATEFTFTLRSDVDWSDGSPVTATDVRYAIIRALEPEPAGSELAYDLFPILNAEDYRAGSITDPNLVGVTVLDPTHIRFNLNASTSHFPAIMALPFARPVPSSAIIAYGSAWTEPGNILTNGAYELSAWVHGSSMSLVSNPDFYHADQVQIDQIEFVILDEATAWSDYQAGLLHSVVVPESEWAAAMADPALQQQISYAHRPCTYYYGFNTSKAPFDNVLVRKAFIAAIDRQGLIDAILPSRATPAQTYATPTMVGYVDGVAVGIGIPYNPSQAQSWLAAAGYPGGVGLPPITLMYNTSPGHEAIANFVRQNWIDNLGVTVALDDLDWDPYLDLLQTDSPQVWRLGWCADEYDASNFFDVGIHPNAYGAWVNPSYNTLVALAALAPDEAARVGYYEDIEEIITESDAIMAPIYYYAYGMATDPRLIRSFGLSGYGGHVEDWRLLDQQLFVPLIMR